MSFMLDVALEWYLNQKHLAIFPCEEKKPLVTNGFKAASSDQSKITEWWTQWPRAQIGVPCGSVNQLLAIDIDGPEGEAWFRKQNWPETFTVATSPGHFQYWFKQPDGITTKSNAGKLAPEVDVRGDGSYVIGPFSIHHETKKFYEIVRGIRRAPAPASLLALVTSNGTSTSPVTGNEILKGRRHQTLLSFAGSCRARGMAAPEILAGLETINQKCLPPLERPELEKIAAYLGNKPAGFSRHAPTETSAEVEVESYSEVVAEELRWTWKQRIPRGKLTIFSGPPGQGKSLASLDVAARISCGVPYPDGAPSEIGDVILLSGEDDAGDTIRPRLDLAGADVRRVHRIKRVKVTLADGTPGESAFSLSRDLEKLGEAFSRFPEARLFVIDPISAYLGTTTDSWKDSSVRTVLSPLADLAQRTGLSTVAIMHPKKGDGDAMQRIVSGSIAFQAAARAVWGFADDPDCPGRHVMLSVKANLGPAGNGLAYRIEAVNNVPRIIWETGVVDMDVESALGRSSHREERSKIQETTAWLREMLAAGPALVSDLKSEAKASGHSWRSVERAKNNLQAKAIRPKSLGPWFWIARPPTL